MVSRNLEIACPKASKWYPEILKTHIPVIFIHRVDPTKSGPCHANQEYTFSWNPLKCSFQTEPYTTKILFMNSIKRKFPRFHRTQTTRSAPSPGNIRPPGAQMFPREFLPRGRRTWARALQMIVLARPARAC